MVVERVGFVLFFDPDKLVSDLLPSSTQCHLLNEGHTDSRICSYNSPPPQSLSSLPCSKFSYSVTPASIIHIIYSFITCIICYLSSTLGSLLEFKLRKGMKFCLFCTLIYPSIQTTVWHAVNTQQIFIDFE